MTTDTDVSRVVEALPRRHTEARRAIAEYQVAYQHYRDRADAARVAGETDEFDRWDAYARLACTDADRAQGAVECLQHLADELGIELVDDARKEGAR